ncbi:hypothetical protein ACQ4PT_057354 [Festuca glaucescens]
MVAADDCGDMHLLDLVTGKRMPLPLVASLPLIDRVVRTPTGLITHHQRAGVSDADAVDGLIHKAILVHTPDGGVLVVAIYRQPHHRNQWATARPGDGAWKSAAAPPQHLGESLLPHAL